jgi:hydrogenase maturation protein HypF
LVQGVGFRPFVYRLAKKYQLCGSVANRSDGVIVKIQGDATVVEKFIQDIITDAPPAAFIKRINSTRVNDSLFSGFEILPSKKNGRLYTEISPDIAVCEDCLADLKTQKHRINYPLINCTNCGPRFSIIKELPYDREKTTMSKFKMCPVCQNEYHDIDDRRFHAQPVACNYCGPAYEYVVDDKILYDIPSMLNQIASQIDRGDVVVIKGVGGYNLVCNALNEQSVKRIRTIKNREAKPFAVMFKNVDTIKHYCVLSDREKTMLESWRRPIVILAQKELLCSAINHSLGSLGVILPYLPLHYLLFDHLKTPGIVFTSANKSDEPLVAGDQKIKEDFLMLSDGVLRHNRNIFNPVDDSVIKVGKKTCQVIRRSRGYVPNPVELNSSVDAIFAAGAEQKNTFCIGKDKTGILSQHIGDLTNYETFQFYIDTVEKFFDLYHFKPEVLVCDQHPAYLSTKFTDKFAGLYLPDPANVIRVQHHHAHIASCLAEHKINHKVIGVCFDGTGYGTDGNIWGGEFLLCDSRSFERYAHFDYVKMPGGDAAAKEPWRMAVAYFEKYFGGSNEWEKLQCFEKVDQKSFALLRNMIQKNINSPLTSSAGRLFDAVAGMLNLCSFNSFEAEAPMRLESVIDKSVTGSYPYQIFNDTVRFDQTIGAIISDLHKMPVSNISAKFHNTVVNVIVDLAGSIGREEGVRDVVLSGGVFQNTYLLEKSVEKLRNRKFSVYYNEQVPANDGGISLGQLIVASNNL